MIGLDPFDPTLPPAPTDADLHNPEYRYLKCTLNYCCGSTRQDLIAEWVLAGIPPEWHGWIVLWKMGGHTLDQVLDYAPKPDDPFYQPKALTSHLSNLMKAGITGDQTRDFLRTGIFISDQMIAVRNHGADPAILAAWTRTRITEDDGANFGSWLVANYTRWTQVLDADPHVINAALARDLDADTIHGLALAWDRNTYPETVTADQVLALHAAGITAAELAADPTLADADPDTLTTLAALRTPAPR